jgi:hypothetical protein
MIAIELLKEYQAAQKSYPKTSCLIKENTLNVIT